MAALFGGDPLPLRFQAPAWERFARSSCFYSCGREAGASRDSFPSWSVGTRRSRTDGEIACTPHETAHAAHGITITTGDQRRPFARVPLRGFLATEFEIEN